jgi:hypothetical protein
MVKLINVFWPTVLKNFGQLKINASTFILYSFVLLEWEPHAPQQYYHFNSIKWTTVARIIIAGVGQEC